MSLRRSKNLLKRAFDSISDMVYIVDENYNIVYANKALGKRAVGKYCYEATHGYDKPCWMIKDGGEKKLNCPYKIIFRTGKPASVLHEHVKGKKVVDSAVFAYPIKNKKGKVVGFVEFNREL